MKITAARTIVCSSGRNFVSLKIETDQGLYGIGDATFNGRELAVAAYLDNHVIPCLIGMDPRRIEDTWQYLYRGAYWRKCSVTMSAMAAVDTALWDIKAKMANMPLYQLARRPQPQGRARHRRDHRRGRRIYRARLHGDPCADRRAGDQGRLRGGPRQAVYEPADAALPSVTGWNTAKSLGYAPSCSRSCARPTASTITCSTTATIAIGR